jgi:hypothetical protein
VPAAFCTSDNALLQAMYAAMDDSNRGWISFSQFACALSTLYRGDKDDILTFWFRMYDRDRDGFLDKEVGRIWVALFVFSLVEMLLHRPSHAATRCCLPVCSLAWATPCALARCTETTKTGTILVFWSAY